MKISITVITLSLSLCASAQDYVGPELISSGGDHVELTDMNVIYSIGEPIIGASSSGSVNLTQGFHQTQLTITSIEKLEESGIRIFPNPTNGILTLELGINEFKNLQVIIQDGKGSRVLTQILGQSRKHDINASQLSKGIYTLTLMDGEKILATSKIIKQ